MSEHAEVTAAAGTEATRPATAVADPFGPRVFLQRAAQDAALLLAKQDCCFFEEC